MMRKSMTTLLLMLNMIGMLLAGCGPQGESLEWEKIAQSMGGGQAELYRGKETMMVITDREGISSIEKYMPPSHHQQILGMDFSNWFAIAVFQGYHGVADYSVEVEDVKRNGDVIIVYARFLGPPTPASGEVVGLKPITTSPYYVLKAKKTPDLHGEFIFVLMANGEEIMRQVHIVP